jgi:hypothetical protein
MEPIFKDWGYFMQGFYKRSSPRFWLQTSQDLDRTLNLSDGTLCLFLIQVTFGEWLALLASYVHGYMSNNSTSLPQAGCTL